MNQVLVSRTIKAVLGLFVCMGSMLAVAQAEQSKGNEVSSQRIKIDDYQNFLKNWDSVKHPVLYALIQNASQYDMLFAPAAVGGSKKPFAPDGKVYEKEQLLIVAKEMIAPPNMEASFEVEKLSEEDGNLVLSYVYNRVKSNATYSVKNYLGLRIPKKAYRKLILIQNGEKIGELQLDQGEWVMPKVAEK
jgi:hypothetical protein